MQEFDEFKASFALTMAKLVAVQVVLDEQIQRRVALAADAKCSMGHLLKVQERIPAMEEHCAKLRDL